jgi:hypothetical protein
MICRRCNPHHNGSGFKTPSEAQWSANIRGGLQASDKCASARVYGGLRFLDRPDALPLNLI